MCKGGNVLSKAVLMVEGLIATELQRLEFCSVLKVSARTGEISWWFERRGYTRTHTEPGS